MNEKNEDTYDSFLIVENEKNKKNENKKKAKNKNNHKAINDNPFLKKNDFYICSSGAS
jgi:hypothetical protein